MHQWIEIGVLVGMIMGLTGAGGSMLGVPLFIHLLGFSIVESTIYALYTVMASSVTNWFIQRRQTDFSTAVTLALFSLIGSLVFTELKSEAPTGLIQAIFVFVCSASLGTIWFGEKLFKIKKVRRPSFQPLRLPIGGFFLGGLATLTGLGGGVVLVPWLSGPLRFSMKRAVATSLFTISLISSGSLMIQLSRIQVHIYREGIVALTFGCILSSFLTKFLLSETFSEKLIARIRKWTFTAVVAFAIVGVLAKL